MNDQKQNWLEKTPIPLLPWLNIEIIIFALIMVFAVITRYYDLGTRAMSHDESLHTYFSYLLYTGQGYQHNPMMHGPLQFHLIAVTYFIFGANDFTARIPAATFSILAIGSIWIWRRYIGRTGALVAAFMALISPFLLYYARYTREDSYIALSTFVLLFSVLRYFETGKPKYIYLSAGALVIHFLTKETAFIYTAQLLIYLFALLLVRILRNQWSTRKQMVGFVTSLAVGIFSLGTAAILALEAKKVAAGNPTPAGAGNPLTPSAVPFSESMIPIIILSALGLIGLSAAIYFLIKGYGLEKLRREHSFDLLIVFGSIVLPMLSALPITIIGWDPLDYTSLGLLHTSAFLFPIILISIVIGVWWNREVWWKMALIFWVPYILLYTTVFTNGSGFFTGIVGSLGYWLQQQGVQRGSQPMYYYLLITIPIYEFLPALACILAAYFSLKNTRKVEAAELEGNAGKENVEEVSGTEVEIAAEKNDEVQSSILTNSLLGWWTIITIFSLSIAGEKMPWLTFHFDIGMVLWGGWGLGLLIDKIDWAELRRRNIWLILSVMTVLILSTFGLFLSLLGNQAPFQGKELVQMQATTTFIFAVVGMLASFAGLYKLLKGWEARQANYLVTLLFFFVMAILTIRTTIRANYILFNSAKEYLVYAHSYSGVKDLLNQVNDLSEKTVGGKDIVVAYDDDTSWPMSWYMREYPNARFYGGQPDRSLKDVPAIIVGDNNFSKIEPIVADNFYRFDYIRMVWPNQDYFNLVTVRPIPDAPFDPNYSCNGALGFLKLLKGYDFSRLCYAVLNPQMRQAIFNIWLNRDYKLYGELTNNTGINDTTWEPSDKMRLYVRKDIVDKVWNYGIKTVAQPKEDPYAKGVINLAASQAFGSAGTEPGQFNAPRGLAIAKDGSIYVADSRNNRIQHFSPDGKVLNIWGTFADQSTGNAPIGTFNEPWGVAVGPDGSVYVSDTWNHRIQKFSADGKPVKMWGVFGTAETPGALYGPRGISVDASGKVYVADTGNKRIVVYDSDGNILTLFGSEGFDPGQFSEPVDVKVDSQGKLYVTDTWNQRIQVLETLDGINYTSTKQWPVSGWNSQSLDNKPFLAIRPNGHILVTDPEGYRVIEFNNDGGFAGLWGQFGTDNSSFGLPSGIAVDSDGNIWVADSGNNRLMKFVDPLK